MRLIFSAFSHALAYEKVFDYNMATMKRSCLCLLTLTFTFLTLTGCSKSKDRLTYGTFINQSLDSLKELDTGALYEKANNENEVFLLATYQKEYSIDCLCWSTFENVVVQYMNKQNERVYLYNTENQDESISNLKITKHEDSTPGLYIFKGTKQLARFSYKSNKDKEIFSDTTASTMANKVHNYVNDPLIYDVDDAFLKENLEKTNGAVVVFAREKCGDCQYVLPNVIIPYINKKSISRKIWLFDLQKQYDLSRSETASEEEKAQYQTIKDHYGLSEKGNQTFGYSQGVVPTIQFYERGVLKDASVYFNDVISQDDEGFYISDSYYTSERVANLSFLKYSSITTTVLKGKKLTDGVLQTKTGAYYWSQEEAAKYHTPILEAFLDYYLLAIEPAS